jgi:hypothetical protein
VLEMMDRDEKSAELRFKNSPLLKIYLEFCGGSINDANVIDGELSAPGGARISVNVF